MPNTYLTTENAVRLAGIAQIALALCSTIVPKVLRWPTELRKVQPLIKQIFWVYAIYILTINLSFGTVSVCCADKLTDGSTLATLLSAFIAVYWVSRVMIQFFYFDRSNFPKGGWLTFGETVLVSTFVLLSITYGWAFLHNLNG